MYKPPRSHHSSVSGRCITKLDHFCPWVNNEVGVWNHKYFILFVSYTAVQCLIVFALCVRAYVMCGVQVRQESSEPQTTIDDDGDGYTYKPPAYCSMKLGGAAHAVTVFSVLFAVFTSCMAIDQIEGVSRGR